MLKGEAYLHSDTKARFDRKIALALLPAYVVAKETAAAHFGFEMYTDARVGQNGQMIEIPKIKTLDDDGNPLGPMAESFRRKGFDELPQLELILDGVMSVVGRRHLVPEEELLLREVTQESAYGKRLQHRRDNLVIPAKCGFLSSFAVKSHLVGPIDAIQRYEMDEYDHENASLAYDVRLAATALKSLALNELKNGTNTITA